MPSNELGIGASYEVIQRYTCKNRVTKAKIKMVRTDVSMTQDVLMDIKTPSSIENTNPDYYKQELARIAELEEENDRLQCAWFEDETICPDGSLKPKVSALLSRIAELEHRNKVLEDACEMLRKENGRVTQLLDFWKGLSTNGRKVQE